MFVVDDGPFLDTACLFSGSGPLVIEVEVDRVVGSNGKSIQELIANGVIAPNAELILPAFDVDFAGASGVNPERDRITLNGTVLNPQYLTGSNNVWKLNSFTVPTELLRFPQDPGASGSLEPEINTVEIDIDTANSDEIWCTAVDWVAIVVEVSRPIALFHGILSDQYVWNAPWVGNLEAAGFLLDRTNLGRLDSIQANAAKIAGVVDRMRDRWGVDKVNIVSHSKGGLDSRHYVERRDTVERVIQIGTPNAGAPLANYAQIGSAVLFGIAGTVAIDLALPAGYQLTTWHMDSYNGYHPLNSKVKYTAMAGDYSATLFDPINLIIGSLTPGPDDLIVPVASVHALPIADERTHSSSGNDETATHFGVHTSSVVYNKLVGTATAFGRDLEPGNVEPLMPRTGSQGTMIPQGGVATFTVEVEAEQPVVFTLTYGLGDLDLAVITPSGIRIDASTVDSAPGYGYGTFEDFDGLKMEGISAEVAEVGAYTLEVTAPRVTNPEGEEPFLVSGWLTSSDLTFDATVSETAIPAGQPLELLATLLEDGVGLDGATVQADLRTPDGAMLQVLLNDDGNGLYTASVSPPLVPGPYRVRVRATGNNRGGRSFSREDSLIASVGETASSISGPYGDAGQDLNGNGLYDLLAVEVGLDVTAAADYRLVGVLTDATGGTVIANAVVQDTLPAGPVSVTLEFAGEEVFASRMDGPYSVHVVRLAEETADGELLPIDEATAVHSTQSYDFQDFEHDAVLLTGNATLTELDDDGNGLFDRLLAEVEVEVVDGGANEWSARLLDPAGDEVEFASASGILPAGPSLIALEFDGCRVRATAVEGTFTVEDLLLFGDSGALVATEALVGGDLDAEDFQCDDSDLADVGVSLDASPNPVSLDGTLVVELSVVNGGPSTATDVTLQTTVSGMGQVDSVSASQGVCSADDAQVFCSFESIPVGEVAFVSVLVTPTGTGTIAIEAGGMAAEVDLQPQDNVAAAEVAVGSVLEIPTVDSTGMLVMAVLLATLGIFVLRYRRRTS